MQTYSSAFAILTVVSLWSQCSQSSVERAAPSHTWDTCPSSYLRCNRTNVLNE